MLFTIIGNVIALGAVAALVNAVIKKDRSSRDVDGDAEELNDLQGANADRSSY